MPRRVRRALGDRRIIDVRIPDGEQYKTMEYVARVLDVMVANRFGRDCIVLALGGGVVGDLAGFSAACYQRGVAFAQMPTTLLAQVDSSVGGKTGVNHPGGKNLIGAFHQPSVVFSDTTTLTTLPPRELRAGLAEVVKYGLMFDLAFLEWIEANVEKLLAARYGRAGLCHPSLVRAQGRCGPSRRARNRRSRAAEPRAYLRARHRDGHRATRSGCTARPSPPAWSLPPTCRRAWACWPAPDVQRVRELLHAHRVAGGGAPRRRRSARSAT